VDVFGSGTLNEPIIEQRRSAEQRCVARERDYHFESSCAGSAVRRGPMESVHGIVAGLDVHKKTVVVVVLHADCCRRIRHDQKWIKRIDRLPP
jgi:hypothetical protein